MSAVAIIHGDMLPLGGFANYGPAKLAELTFSSVRSARRWIAAGLAPCIAVRFLELIFRGPLGLISHKWDGWSLRRDVLHSPDGYAFEPGEITSIPLRHAQIAALEFEIRRLQARCDEYERAQRDQQRPGRQAPCRYRHRFYRVVSHLPPSTEDPDDDAPGPHPSATNEVLP